MLAQLVWCLDFKVRSLGSNLNWLAYVQLCLYVCVFVCMLVSVYDSEGCMHASVYVCACMQLCVSVCVCFANCCTLFRANFSPHSAAVYTLWLPFLPGVLPAKSATVPFEISFCTFSIISIVPTPHCLSGNRTPPQQICIDSDKECNLNNFQYCVNVSLNIFRTLHPLKCLHAVQIHYSILWLLQYG